MSGYSERREQLSIDNAFHVQVVIHLESLDRNRGRLTKKPVHLPVIVMALAQRALQRSALEPPYRRSRTLLHVGETTLVHYCIPFSMEWLISSLGLSS